MLGRRLGHDPRRGDVGERLRDPGAVRRRLRDRRLRRQPDPRLRRGRGAALLRAGQPGRAAGPLGDRPARPADDRRARAATTSCRSPAPTPARRTATRRSRTSRGCSTGRWTSTVSPSTPTCAGRCCRHWPGTVAPTVTGSTTSWPATTPSPARSTRPRPGPCDPPPRPRPRRGSRRWSATTSPTRPSAASCSRSAPTGRTRCSSRTSRSTSAVADTIWEDKGTQRASTVLEYIFPKHLASQALLDRLDQWLEESPANPAAKRYVRENRGEPDDIARALRAQAKDARRRAPARALIPRPAGDLVLVRGDNT